MCIRDRFKHDGFLILCLCYDDLIRIIGKQGRIAKAIRSVVKAAASKEEKKVIVEIMQ